MNESRLLSAKELAHTMSLSKRQIFRLNTAGKLPAPLKIGGSIRWRADEIDRWLAAGAVDRRTWEDLKEAEAE
jgi:excisionase family DNA binding protein